MRSSKIGTQKQKSGTSPHIFIFPYLSHTISYICFTPGYLNIPIKTITHFFHFVFFIHTLKQKINHSSDTKAMYTFFLVRSFFYLLLILLVRHFVLTRSIFLSACILCIVVRSTNNQIEIK